MSWSTRGIRYTCEAPWPKSGEKGTASYSCFFIRRGGASRRLPDGGEGGQAWHGGKFDWARTGRGQTREWRNVFDGYRGHKAPRKGDRVGFCLLKLDGRERTDLATWVWE